MLKLEGINKIFNEGTPDEKVALDNINLHLAPGDFVTIIGSNGAGKSTMMNMISGALTPDFGAVSIDKNDGERINSPAVFVFSRIELR